MRILFLDLDSLSPDHMSCYGYHRNTTPNIDRIAAEGVRFTNYYTSDAPCAPSRTALMSGKHGIVNGLVGHGGTAGDMKLEGQGRELMGKLTRGGALPSYLQLAGSLNTALISPFAQRHSTFAFYAGFNEIINTGKYGNESAEHVTPVALDWIDRHAKKDDWFLYINYWDPHTPYRAPMEFGNPFEHEPLPEWLTEEVLEQHKQMVGSHSAQELVIDFQKKAYTNRTSPSLPRQIGEIQTMDDLRSMIDGYDCGIRYMDEHLGRLFAALTEQGVMDDLIVIISADHGENMGQLGIYGEHATADQGTCRLPMIIRWPGMKQGIVDEGLHYHVDLLPTLADMLGGQPFPEWTGASYAPVLREGADCGRDYLVISQCAHVAQRGVRFGDWLYIRTYHDGFHLFDREMLFNLKDDPKEQHNLAAERRDLCMQAVYYLNDWHDEMMSRSGDDTDPLWTVMKEGGPFHARGYLPNYIKRLEETGRGHHVAELVRRHPGEFPQEPDSALGWLQARLHAKMRG
ncbi:Arylsulfatase A [Paenibacillus sp. UNCCL117]|uniref:sulfatase family protein n=1 Tax=unclassified Paenibacillus TaxID=185978 RepID=UPI00088C8869|nr:MULTISPECIES: sulfatase [unclassified Paenibacillus]SDE20488.1 Arylsulfatase A [Paenibacillus sp. cl123]SFW61716.1 Arylsulfatase A [Paenibacillus sp. UNCCL117]